MMRRPIDGTLLLTTVVSLAAAVLAGCGRPVGTQPQGISPAWLAALPGDQRTELLRPVVALSPDEVVASKNLFEVTISTGRPGDLVLAAAKDGASELPVELAIEVRDRDGKDALAAITCTVTDLYGRRVAGGPVPELAVPAGGSVSRKVPLPDLKEPGCYEATVELVSGGATQRVRHTLAILPAPPAEKSAAWLVGPGTKRAAPAARRIGCTAVYLADLIAGGAGITNLAERSPERQWTPAFDAAPLRTSVDSFEQTGLAVIGQIASAPQLQVPQPAVGNAIPGLPANVKEFAACVAPLAGMLTKVEHWDLAPLPLGWLDASPAALRDYLAVMQAEIERQRTGATTYWVSGTVPAINDLLTAPGMTGLVDGLRFVDYQGDAAGAADVARRAGAKRWLAVLPAADAGATSQARAWQIVKSAVAVLAAGGDVELTEESILDPAQAAAVSTLVARTGGAKCRSQVWPALPLSGSAVFDSRSRRVAVLWTEGAQVDLASEAFHWTLMEIPEARGIEVADVMGRPVGIWRERSLILPLGPGPIYVTSDLSADNLARRLRDARVVTSAPPTFQAATIAAPLSSRTLVAMDVIGTSPAKVEVNAAMEKFGPATTLDPSGPTVHVGPGEQVRLAFPLQIAAADPDNAYPARFRIRHGEKRPVSFLAAHVFHQAVAPRLSATIDGRLDEWADAPAMKLALPWLDAATDTGPAKADVAANAPSAASVAQIRTAHDDDFFYISAEVPIRAPLKRERTVEPVAAGQVGNPWGPESIQVALGTTGSDLPEYVLALVPTATRPAVVLMHGPGMDRRTPLPGLPLQGWGELPGARSAIVSSGDRVVYEAAIPRKALAALPWGEGRSWQFDFLIEGPADSRGVSQVAQWAAVNDPLPWQTSRRTYFPLGRETVAARCELGLVREAVAK